MTIFRIPERNIADSRSYLSGFGTVALRGDLELEGFFASFPSEAEPPSWQESVAIVLAPGTIPNLTTQRPGGAIFVQTCPAVAYILAFGTGWTKIDRNWIDRDFGRRVVLNCTPKTQVTELKTEQVFAGWHTAYERSPMPAMVEKFNVEADRDLVHAVEGRPEKQSAEILGAKISGSASLSASIDFSKLREVLDFVETLQTKSTYLSTYPQLNSLRPVTDPDLISTLNIDLDAALKQTQKLSSMVLSVPVTRHAKYSPKIYGEFAAETFHEGLNLSK